MNKNQAQELIREIFRNPFDRERYQHFLRNLLNKFAPRENKYYKNARLWEKFWPHINHYERIGKYVDPDGVELDLLVVEVPSFSKLESARTTLRNLVVKHLKTFGEKNYALVAFYAKDDGGGDWRFSFVKIEHESILNQKGKVNTQEVLTPAKRHSFLVGVHEDSHTAGKNLLPLLEMDYTDPRIEEIEAAFSIETVTEEFFDQYKALFQKLGEHLKKQRYFQKKDEEESSQAVSRFAKKLLGQIVFLYFLQKKGWLGAAQNKSWGEGSRRFMRERYDQVTKSGGNYYHDFLQYLFYDALACERKNQKDPGYYERFHCRVPFLNGGLFEADYDWHKETIDLPNTLFHNDEKTKAGDIGTGILDVFDRYNFTIKEDEPLEKDVAVDPEMLGKVFENMLEVTERKSKGAFYTPREIVHYMCQESLIHYLDNHLNSYATSYCDFDSPQTSFFGNEVEQGQLTLTEEHQDIKVPKTELETLIRKGHLFVENDEAALQALQRIERGEQRTTKHKIELPDSVKAYAQIIDAALADIKVCDPAIGSGAFPLGLLHEIVNARCALAPHSGQTLSPYALKRHAIAESLYGVDTDASAIDIARLRLWLSLIVEEGDYDTIEALPNLDYKIMQGNSLIEEYEGVKLFDEAFIQNEEESLKKEKAKLKQKQSTAQTNFLAAHNLGNKELESQYNAELTELHKAIQKLEQQEKRAAKEKTAKADGLFDLISEARKKANQLETLHNEFFAVSSLARKRQLRDRITQLEWELIEATLAEQGKTETLKKLAEYKSSGEKPFFLWKLNFSEVFKQKSGFDVVIGNPPYVQIQNFSGQPIQKDWEKQRYETFAKTGDIYCLFYEKGYRLLRNQGVLAFITSNKWMRAAYGEKLRKFFSEQTQPLILIDFSSFQVFKTATVDTNVLLFRKKKREVGVQACLIDPSFARNTPLEAFVARKSIELDNLSGESWVITSRTESWIKKQIEKVGTPLKDWDIAIYRGILTGFNEAFIIPGWKKDELIAKDSKSAEIIKPILRGRDIKRYQMDFADCWLIATFPALNLNINEYPAVRDYLKSFGRKLHQTGEVVGKDEQGNIVKSRKKTGNKWFETQDQIGYYKEFEKEKIVYPDIMRLPGKSSTFSDFPYMYLDKDGYYVEATNFILTGVRIRTILAVVTSELGIYAFISFYSGPIFDNKGFRYKKAYLEDLPVPNVDISPLNCCIDYSHLMRKSNQRLISKYFEQLIDGLVYELYFPDEIKTANKAILPHLGELTPITLTMTEEEKLAVIQRKFDRLYDPRHPVRNHLETLDSVEVVRTIRQALKR